MATIELKITRIGNSRGIRIPATTLERYRIGDTILMEELSDAILLRPVGSVARKLSWEDTAAAMAASDEDWSEWDVTAADGLDELSWNASRSRRGAEPSRKPRRKR